MEVLVMRFRRRVLEIAAEVFFPLMLAFVLCAVLAHCPLCESGVGRVVESEALGCDARCQVELGIRRLQPAASEERAQALAEVFVAAGAEANLDPLLLVAIAMRESSLHPAVEQLAKRGSVGELGLMQINPAGPALRMRPQDCPETLEGAACQVRTGARFLAFTMAHCPGSWSRGVSAYGRSSCPSDEEATADRNVVRARRYYEQAGGRGWR
jgi:hypothetical protein